MADSASRWKNLSSRVIAAFLSPPAGGRGRAIAIISAMIGSVGFADFLAPIEVSLAAFYLVPISLTTGWFGVRAGVWVTLASTVIRVLSDAATVYPAALPWHTWWNAAASLAISLFVVWVLDALLAVHRRLESDVRARTAELQQSVAERDRLQREILEVAARERNAFGRELHDELGQHFVATAFAAQVLAKTLDEAHGADKARAIAGWIEDGVAKTRKLARGLLLAHIEPQRLPQELEELALSVSRSGVPCRAVCEGPPVAVSADDCAQLFRIAQEAVGNALRHAAANKIDIRLATDAQGLTLAVEDDGGGLPPGATAGTGMGLRIMEHRARLIGGTFALTSVPGRGTCVTCRLSYPAAPAVRS